MRFFLQTLAVMLAIAAVAWVLVIRERARQERESGAIQELRSWAVSPDDVIISYAQCLDIEPGLRNLVVYAVRKRLGTQKVNDIALLRVDNRVGRHHGIPGETLAKFDSLQGVTLILRGDNVDLSELTKTQGLRGLRLYGICPASFDPLGRFPHLEALWLQLQSFGDYKQYGPGGHFTKLVVAKNLKRLFSNWARDRLTAPLRQSLPNCKILWQEYDLEFQ